MIFNTMLGYWGFTHFFQYWKIKGSSWKWPIYFLYPVIIIHYNMKTLDFADTGSTGAWMAYTQFLRIVSWDQVRSEVRSARRSRVEQISWSWIRPRRWVEWVMGVGGASRSSRTRVREVKLVWKQDVQQVTLTNREDRGDGAFAVCHSCLQSLIRKINAYF